MSLVVTALSLGLSLLAAQNQRSEVKWNIPDGPAIPGVTHHVLRSPSMGMDVGYNVYLPPGYEESADKYPVVYFLHGAGGTENSDAGGFSGLVSKLIDAKAIPPVICVFPNGGMSGYQDRPDQKIMGETLIVRELLPEIDSHYRTKATASGRSLAGFSMGGGGAMRLATKYPDLFSAAGSWAAALMTRGGVSNPADVVRANKDKLVGHVRLLMVVGDKDLTFASHSPFIQALDEIKLPYTYKVLPDIDHNLGIYYEQTGEQLVKFVTEGFR